VVSHERRADDLNNDTGLVVLKFTIFGALYAALLATFGDTAGGIVALAATVGAIGYLFSRIVVPGVAAIKLIQELPARLTTQDDQLEQLQADTELIKAGALAAAERAESAMRIAADVAEKADAAARASERSVNVVKAIARAVGASVRGEPED
jgi:methyl-accepting chemotaxis protein